MTQLLQNAATWDWTAIISALGAFAGAAVSFYHAVQAATHKAQMKQMIAAQKDDGK